MILQRHRSEDLVTTGQGNVIVVYAGNPETLIQSERMKCPRVIDASFNNHIDFGPMCQIETKLTVINHRQIDILALVEFADQKFFLFSDQRMQEADGY